MPAKPKSVVYLRPDTIGDLVIFQPALARLEAAWPEARHTLVVRPGYEALAPLFSDRLQWRPTPINPFRQRPSECRPELAALVQALDQLQPDLILAPALNRTWLEAALAAHFPRVRSVVLGGRAVDPIFQTALRLDLGVDEAKAFGEIIPIREGDRDWDNQHAFVDRLLGEKGSRAAPALALPAAAVQQAERFLAGHQLANRPWAAVFAGGLANVQVKAWPAENFGQLTQWLQDQAKLPVVLLGHVSEAAWLARVADEAERRGGRRPLLWLGQDGELPLLAALLRQARLYVGHDTGALHLAAAVGRPVVGIFGGGHWPRFRPVGRQTLSVVQPLPCFGCNWDCHFGDGPCVKTLAVADVVRGVEQVLADGDQPFDRVLEARNLSDDALRLIAAEAPGRAALQRDRLDRQHKIEELKAESDAKDVEIAALKRIANEREAESDAKDGEIADLKRIANEREAESDAKDGEIADLKKETDGKDGEITALKRAANDRKAESDTKDGEIADLKRVCNEREALILEQDGHIKTFQRMVAELNAAHGEKDRRLAAAEAARLAAEGILAQLPADAPDWAGKFAAQNTHIRNLEAIRAQRDREAVEKDRSLANHAAGHHGLEQAKHYGRLLAEKENVIQELHRACVEREAVIRQLAAEAAGPLARLRQLGLAARAYVREKGWRPLDAWIFRKTVEEYWMQIGVLRHYEPRAIAWDSRMPKRGRLPEARLPRIGIVTPSYGQPAFLESTLLSVLNQNYPKLIYVVQDGGSDEATLQVIRRQAARLRHWASAPDRGQGDAIRKGFARIEAELGPDDVMAWLNSDDFVAPRTLRFVAEYFATHPAVDVIYGHRIIIDSEDREIGRWIMPRHDAHALEWIDYVPQETLFWRKRAWDLSGGVDPSYQFALDWDLLARFQKAGCRMVRLPYFLGCFRVHGQQKTSQVIHTTGAEEMARVRESFHPGRGQDDARIAAFARKTRFRGALVARLLAAGLRW